MPSRDKNENASSNNDTGSSNQQVQDSVQKDEREFISIVNSFETRYEEASNEFQKSAVRRERAVAFANIISDRSVQNWIGKISSMETNSDGNGILYVELPGSSRIKVTTWNNSFSDIEDNTLIPHSSFLYNQVANLAQGDVVYFSGRFASGGLDFIKESSMTEASAMTAPEFIFTFTRVGKQPLVYPDNR
jgi:hypothetical protein